ncbi:MAG TPA: glutamate--tRNA ligase [Alphaproteobacteria bacterium]|nr:glutamate--tRNA ligase [Alphaproteobacteria bacterium]
MTRVRFAPSPTGKIHIGNTRTALLNYLHAKKTGGTFILRIEDTDSQRNVEGSEARLIEDLKWLGIVEDEGTVAGGDYAPYRDSEIIATGIYEEVIADLKAKDHLYECFVSQEELDIMRKIQTSQGKAPKYDNRHRNLSEEEKAAFIAEGRTPVLRFKMPEKEISWNDLVRGEVKFHTSNLGGDPVVVRSNGIPVFALANAINDELHKVSLVIRGEDHTANTAQQIAIYEALGYDIPQMAHTPMLLDTDGSKLSKRLGSLGIRDLKAEGYLPQAITGLLASLSMGSEAPVAAEIEELAAKFDLAKMGRNSAKFDIEQVKRLNAQFIQTLSYEQIKPYLDGFMPETDMSEEKIALFWEAIKKNITLLSDLKAEFDLCFNKKGDEVVAEEDKEFIKQALEVLPESFDETTWKTLTSTLKEQTDRKGKQLFMPLRVAITGFAHGPEMGPLLNLMGREIVKARLEQSL